MPQLIIGDMKVDTLLFWFSRYSYFFFGRFLFIFLTLRKLKLHVKFHILPFIFFSFFKFNGEGISLTGDGYISCLLYPFRCVGVIRMNGYTIPFFRKIVLIRSLEYILAKPFFKLRQVDVSFVKIRMCLFHRVNNAIDCSIKLQFCTVWIGIPVPQVGVNLIVSYLVDDFRQVCLVDVARRQFFSFKYSRLLRYFPPHKKMIIQRVISKHFLKGFTLKLFSK